MLTARKWLASDPFHLFITTRAPNTFHGNQTPHGKVELEKGRKKGCFSRLVLRHFGPEKRSLGPPIWCKTHSTMIKGVGESSTFVPMQMAPPPRTSCTNCLKKNIFCLLLIFFERACHLQPLFPAATIEFPALNLCDCPEHPWVSCTKVLARSKGPQQSCAFSPFCVCVRACCCLLLAKPSRSTLDTKEGHKTKTASTSSVTLSPSLLHTRDLVWTLLSYVVAMFRRAALYVMVRGAFV